VLFALLSLTFAKLAPLLRNGEEIIENRFIVVFKEQTSFDVVQNSQAQFGDRVKYTYQHTIKGFAVELDSEELLALRTNPSVAYITYDGIARLSDCQSQPAGSWGQTRICQTNLNLQKLQYYADSSAGAGVNVYILDTGIYVNNEDFTTKPAGTTKFLWKAEPSWSDEDRNGHGTHVASTVAGAIYGVAKRANLFAVKVLGDNGAGSWAGVIAGVDFVAGEARKDRTKKVTANMSLGGDRNVALNAAVNAAVDMGVVFVVAAGNENTDACSRSPASAAGAITVGATSEGPGNTDVRASYSNYGDCVDIFAPGSAIRAAWIGTPKATNTISGTSMASPHVCGVSALLLGENDGKTPAQIKTLIVGDATEGKIQLNCGNSVCVRSPNLMLFNGCLAPSI